MRTTKLGIKRRRGNSIVEFALVSVFLVPLLLGTVNVGMNLGRSIQSAQICRDAGHMYVRQVDFSQPKNQDIIVRVAQGFNMTRNGGDGVVILSRVMYIGAAECAAGGLSVSQCPNYNQPVFTQRIVIGKKSLRESAFGAPKDSIVGSDGSIAPEDYLRDPTAVANGFSRVLQLQPGELGYVSEVYFPSKQWNFPGVYENTGVYARNIF